MPDVVRRAREAQAKAKEASGLAKRRYLRVRRDTPLLDLVLRIQERYTAMGGRQQAGAITYYGFLSFFPILALAFAAVGWSTGSGPEPSAP